MTNLAEVTRKRVSKIHAGELSSATWVTAALFLILALFIIMNPAEFGTASNLSNIALDASILLVLAVGGTYVLITGGVDLSIGSVLVFSSVAGAKVMQHFGGAGGDAVIGGLAAALVAGAGWGFINGFVITRMRVAPLVVTLGTLGMALGFALMWAGGNDLQGVPPNLVYRFGLGNILPGIPAVATVAAFVALVAGVVLAWTKFGRYTYAIGSNSESSKRAGIAVDRHLIKVYMLGGLLAGLAGFLSLARFGTTSIAGHNLDNMNALTGVIIGGTSLYGGVGKVFGTVIGTLIPAVLQNGFVIAGLPPYWQQVAVGAVLIFAVYLDRARRDAELS
ncbi:ribose transport system permease protein [Kribbella sp. VKM Ac-2527]|uniref:Ribose transport system permease protein n=1 Tax=Kribbella caucasensis TaxID=2512215 RepID=A0A4R6KHP2_9ACTN|nr:ABC transporter permease [Kribbella sp. VKM Ac-2527]TDO50524.1 ribose transport system permease protein [Kribbella sp. VKM Ac-2527]